MRALVKPAAEPYADVRPENEWNEWMRTHLDYYTRFYGYTLIEEYDPPEPPEPAE